MEKGVFWWTRKTRIIKIFQSPCQWAIFFSFDGCHAWLGISCPLWSLGGFDIYFTWALIGSVKQREGSASFSRLKNKIGGKHLIFTYKRLSCVNGGKIDGNVSANKLLPQLGDPTIMTLWPLAATISNDLLTCLCPSTRLNSLQRKVFLEDLFCDMKE